jgi:hypothetical protein
MAHGRRPALEGGNSMIWRSWGRLRKMALTVAVSVLALLAFTGLALGSWADLPVDRLDVYGVADSDLAAISQGFPDGN